MAQQLQVFATKPEDPSLIPGPTEADSSKLFLTSTLHICTRTHMPPHTYTINTYDEIFRKESGR